MAPLVPGAGYVLILLVVSWVMAQTPVAEPAMAQCCEKTCRVLLSDDVLQARTVPYAFWKVPRLAKQAAPMQSCPIDLKAAQMRCRLAIVQLKQSESGCQWRSTQYYDQRARCTKPVWASSLDCCDTELAGLPQRTG